jgi:hypothetical protein
LETLAAIHSSRKEIELGPKPRQRIRAGVFAPRLNKQLLAHPVTDIPGSERNNGALNESLPVGGMIDLDGSDAEL